MLKTAVSIPELLNWRAVFPIYRLTKDELETLELLEQVAQEKIFPRALHYHETGEIPIESYKDLADAGLLSLTIPKKYGGHGFSPLAFMLAMLILGQKGDPSVANTTNMNNVVLWFLAKLAKAKQKSFFFPRVVQDGELFAASTSEPGIKWDDPEGTVLYTTLRKLPKGDYLLTGNKWRVSMAHTASHYCVVAVMHGYSTREGMVIAVVPHDTPGVVIKEDWNLPMMRPTDSCSIEFNNCIIPANHIVGKPGELPRSGLFSLFSLGYAAFYLGMGIAGLLAFEERVASQGYWINETESMAFELQRALLTLSSAAIFWQYDDKDSIPLATACAKAYCPEVAHGTLLQISGLGCSNIDPYQRLLTDIQAAKFMPPSPELVIKRIEEADRLNIKPKFLTFRSD